MTPYQLVDWNSHFLEAVFNAIIKYTGQKPLPKEEDDEFIDRMWREGRLTHDEFMAIQQVVIKYF